MEVMENEAPLRERELVGLRALSREIPNIDGAVSEIARFSAELTLPQGHHSRHKRRPRRRP